MNNLDKELYQYLDSHIDKKLYEYLDSINRRQYRCSKELDYYKMKICNFEKNPKKELCKEYIKWNERHTELQYQWMKLIALNPTFSTEHIHNNRI